ncbi:hypothetical protein [Paenibacillus sp.]
MLRIASKLAERERALALITGDSLGQVASQTSRRPSGLRKTTLSYNSLAHRTTWLRSDFVQCCELHPNLPSVSAH